MRIYRISASQGNISFKQNIKAYSYNDAKDKFLLDIKKDYKTSGYIYPEVEINSINTLTRRY